MARWKLMVAHYLNVPDEEWEYVENDRKTGRPIRRKFLVPRLLDPGDPTSWTNKWGTKDNEEGEVIVCLADKGDSHDHIFSGDPTPDMIPLDDEARAISAKFTERWKYKPEEASGQFSQSLIDKFQSDMAEVRTRPTPVEGMSELTAAITAMVTSNKELIGSLTRRV